MLVTVLLTVGMMVLFTLMEWVACEFMPMKSMADFFPEDIQERLRPRLEKLTMTPKRIIGMILFILLLPQLTHEFKAAAYLVEGA